MTRRGDVTNYSTGLVGVKTEVAAVSIDGL